VSESFLRRSIEERLVGREGFAVDASLIKADANRQKGIEGDKELHLLWIWCPRIGYDHARAIAKFW
jgi:hypothetical protein